MTNESISDGPAPGRNLPPGAAVPMGAKMPAPMIAPMPKSVTLNAPSVRRSENCGPPATARMSSRLFVRKRPRSKVSPPPPPGVRLRLFEETRGVLHTGAEKGKSKKAKGKPNGEGKSKKAKGKREEIRSGAALISG